VGENGPVILPKLRLFTPFRDLLHNVYLGHGTEGFTSPPKEGMLRIFSPEPANSGARGQHANH
jgi:hypothetical protein